MMALVLFQCSSSAYAERKKDVEIEAGISYDRMTGDYDDWKSIYLEGKGRIGEGLYLYGTAREVERFSISERELMSGLVLPSVGNITATIEGTTGEDGKILPRRSYLAGIDIALFKGVVLHAGGGEKTYTDSHVYSGNVSFQKYFSDYLGAFTIYHTRVEGGADTLGYSLKINRYYRDRDYAGLIFSFGKEAERISPSVIVSSSVSTIVFLGRSWFAEDWGLTYEAWFHSQGDYYDRYGLRSGLRFRF